MSYALINEVWKDYKYPDKQDFSKTGYDTYNTSNNITLQTEKPQKIEEANKNIYNNNYYHNDTIRSDEPNYKNISLNNSFEGFQPNPMDYPSISKVNIDTYNNNAYQHMPNIPMKPHYKQCDEYIEHVKNCTYCLEHLRKQLGLKTDYNNNNNKNYFTKENISQVLDISLMVLGGVFLLFVIDTFLIIGSKKAKI